MTLSKIFNFKSTVFDLLILAFFIQEFYIDYGLAIKPYMIVGFFFILINIRKVNIQFNLQSCLIFIFFIYSLLSLLFNLNNNNSINMFLGVSLFTLLYFLISSLFKNEKFEVHDLITPGIIITSLSLIYYVMGFANLDLLNKANPISYGLLFDRGMPRFKGFANNPDYINLFIIPFFFSSIIYLKKKSNAKVLFCLCVISILLSMSLASIFVYIIISIVYLINNIRNFFKYFIITAVILIFCSYIISQNIFIYEIFERRLSHVESGSGRFEMWNFGIHEFMNNPIFGSGIGTIKNISLEFGITNMHNTYLELLIEFGIFGSLPFLFMIFSLLMNKKENNSINKKFLFYSSLALILNLFTVSAQVHEMLLFQIFLTQNLNNKVNNKIIN